MSNHFKKTALIALFISLLVLSACSNLKKGVVIDKYIKGPSTIYVKSGNVLIPVRGSREYKIKVRGEVDGKAVTDTFTLDKPEWNKINKGDIYEVKE